MRNATNSNAGNEKAASNLQPNTAMKIAIPKEILAKNHRRAYAMAYKAGYNGTHVKFVSPIVRNSIVRGYLDGEEAREREQLNRTVAQLVWETEEAYWNAVHAEIEVELSEDANKRTHAAA